MSARKTWSDNTIDERSIAFSSSPQPNTHKEYSLCPVTQALSFPPPFLLLFLFVYHGLLSPSYPYVTLTYRVVGIRASCCIRSSNWVSIFTGWPADLYEQRSNAQEILGRTTPLLFLWFEWKFFNHPIIIHSTNRSSDCSERIRTNDNKFRRWLTMKTKKRRRERKNSKTERETQSGKMEFPSCKKKKERKQRTDGDSISIRRPLAQKLDRPGGISGRNKAG